MKSDVDIAKQHIADALLIGFEAFKEAQKLLAKVGCTAVPTKRLEALEALANAVYESVKTSRMTRDYQDVLKIYEGETYNGKRFLIRRNEGNAVFAALQKLKQSGE